MKNIKVIPTPCLHSHWLNPRQRKLKKKKNLPEHKNLLKNPADWALVAIVTWCPVSRGVLQGDWWEELVCHQWRSGPAGPLTVGLYKRLQG